MLSIAICTFNRCQSLARTLDTLAAQVGIDWSDVEVIVVDNNCTDDTAGVVAAASQKLPVRRVVETAQGLSHGRNRALAEFRGAWLIFTDDDVLLDPGWLAAYRDACAAFPEAKFAGGRIIPEWNGPRPHWYKGERLDLIDGILVWYDLGAATRPLRSSDPTPFGASFALSQGAIEVAGRFRSDLGVTGRSSGRGEETEYLGRLRQRGSLGIYVGEALCSHPVDQRRFSMRALYRYGMASGRAHRAIVDKDAAGSRLSALLYLGKGLHQLAKGRGDRYRQCIINAGIQIGLCNKAPNCR